MRKRPLCFLCIVLILIMWILEMSGDDLSSPDVIFSDLAEVTIYGKIYKCEYKEEKLILYLKQAVLPDNSQTKQLNHIRITCKVEDTDYRVSDYVFIKGNIKSLKGPTNPGQFDVRAYYNAQKVSYTMWEPKLCLLERPSFSMSRSLADLRTTLAKWYDRILPNQYGALLKGMTLGEMGDISEEVKRLFQLGGISHILAISALQLQLLGNTLYRLLRKCRVSIGVSAMTAGGILVCYGILTGSSVATLRALIMFLLQIGADVFGRTYDGMTGMAVAAVILIAGNPSYLLYSGFWLSFISVCAFMIFRERRQLASGILLYLFMAPVMMIYFYKLSPYSILLNLFVVPTNGVVMVSGLMGCVFGGLNPLLGKVIVFPAAVLLHICTYLCEIIKKLPGNTVLYGNPNWMQILCYYGIMAAALYFFRKNRIRKIRFISYLFMLPAWLILTYRSITGLKITMLDVGQGDAMVMETETGNAYLIDGGSTSEEAVGEYRILPYLQYAGISELDGVFLTHADEDHINGVLELLQMIWEEETALSIEKLVLPDWQDMSSFSEVINLAERCGIDTYRIEKGGTVVDGELLLTCLHPGGEDYTDNLNEGSMVLRLDYHDFSMLFTGDLEGETESKIAGNYGDVDILKVAHHGSRNSTSEQFLQEVKPEICLISCGEDNRYGHPHEELLERLEMAGTTIFQTSLHGAITIQTEGERIDLKTFKPYNEQ